MGAIEKIQPQAVTLDGSNGLPTSQPAKETSADALMRIVERAASAPDFDVSKLQALLDVRERWEANEARKAFGDAMAQFKAESILIIKDKTNPQYHSNYVSLGNLVATVTPFLSKYGLSASWEIDQTEGIKVVCMITHRLGHSKSCSVKFPPDKSGAKNPIQEIKSAITYARACTFEAVCGLATSDGAVDDDGNGAGQSEKRLDDVRDRIENIMNSHTLDELQKQFSIGFDAARDKSDRVAMDRLRLAKDQRKKELTTGRV